MKWTEYFSRFLRWIGPPRKPYRPERGNKAQKVTKWRPGPGCYRLSFSRN